jgi:hypothetical protein
LPDEACSWKKERRDGKKGGEAEGSDEGDKDGDKQGESLVLEISEAQWLC